MTAIELMDPKMDVGMMCNRKKKILNFEQSVKAGKVKIADFTFEEKIGIIDETYACLATWLDGHSLAQTVFTNLYLHNPSLINDRTMKTFCFSVLKIVDFIKQLVNNNANVIDEEVYQTMFGFQDNILPSSKVSAMLKDLEEDLCKKSRSNDIYYLALYTRIKFTRAFYQYLLFIVKQAADNIPQTIELNKRLEICEESFNDWNSTLDLGIKPDLEKFNENQQDCLTSLANEYPTIMGFSQFVNQRTLPPTFPRYTKIKARDVSIEYFHNLINRFRKIQGTSNCSTFRELLLYCNRLSEDELFYSCICSRCVLNLMNYFQPQFDLHKSNYVSILKDDITNFIKPFYLQNKQFFSIGRSKDYLEFFLEQCQKPFCKLLRTTCLNRARQREKLESVIYDLSSLVTHAEKLDSYFNVQAQKMKIDVGFTDYFNCWTTYYLIKSMIQYLLFGFELELYSEHEYYFIYWYLHENLLNFMVTLLARTRNLLAITDNLDFSSSNKQKGKNGSKPKQNHKQNKHDQNTFHFNEILKYNGLQFLSCALFKICNILMKYEIIKQPKLIADNHQILYFKRLSPFISIQTPPYMNHSKFKDACRREETQIENVEAYIKQSCDHLEEAKKLFEHISKPDKEVEIYLKVVKMNIVVLKLILSGHKKIDDLILDFTINKLYPVVKYC